MDKKLERAVKQKCYCIHDNLLERLNFLINQLISLYTNSVYLQGSDREVLNVTVQFNVIIVKYCTLHGIRFRRTYILCHVLILEDRW